MAVNFSNVSIKNTSTNTNTVFGPGENFTVSFICNNDTNEYIKYINVYLLNSNRYASNVAKVEFWNNINPGSTVNSSVNSRTLRINENCSLGTNLYSYLNQSGYRNINLQIALIAYASNNIIISQSILSLQINAIDKRKLPRFEKFSFKRCNTSGVASDEGTKLLSTIKTAFASTAYNKSFAFTLYQKGTGGSVIQTISVPTSDETTLNNLQNGITNNYSFASSLTLSNNTNYIMEGTLTDGYETATQQFSVPKSFVNVHLSSVSTGGVALGGYSSSTINNPKFESNYHAILNEGLTVFKQSGFGATVTINNGSLKIRNSASDTDKFIVENGTNPTVTIYNGSIKVKDGSNTDVFAVLNTGEVTIGGSVGSISASGPISAGGSISTNGDMSVGGSLSVTNDVNISKDLTVSGTSATLYCPVYLGGPATTGATTTNTIAVVGNLRIRNDSPNFKGGIITGSSLAAGSNREHENISYGATYKTTPYVVATLYSDGDNLSKFSCVITYIGASQFSIKVYNTGSDSHDYKISWMVFGLVNS